MSLESVTERLRASLPQFAGLNARVKFALDEGGVILIDGTQSPPTLSHADEEAACTIRLSEAKLEKLIDGQLSPTLAYTLGQIKVEGSLGVAMKLANLLES
jgi:putative sterol carrier protein